IKPDLRAVGHIGMQRACRETLEPRRPLSMGQPVFERAEVERLAEHDGRGRDRIAGVVDLMTTLQSRQRKVDEARVGLEYEPPLLLEGGEVASGDMERRADFGRPPLDDLERLTLLAPDHARHPRLENAGLFAGDRRDGVAEKGDVVDRDWR